MKSMKFMESLWGVLMALAIAVLATLSVPQARANEIAVDTTVTSGTAVTVTVDRGNPSLHLYRITGTSNADGILNFTFNVRPATPNVLQHYGYLDSVKTDPSATAPTDNWDLLLNDEDGNDMLLGRGANRDTATTERMAPRIMDQATSGTARVPIGGTVTYAATNMGAAKIVTTEIAVAVE